MLLLLSCVGENQEVVNRANDITLENVIPPVFHKAPFIWQGDDTSSPITLGLALEIQGACSGISQNSFYIADADELDTIDQNPVYVNISTRTIESDDDV